MNNPGTTSFTTPEWVKDAVFYQIFPDRFAQGTGLPKPRHLEPWDSPPTEHGFKGGDLVGVAEHLDYLQDLGINALYFSPVFQSAANHRYHTYDYYRVDPLLGGNEALRRLLDECHRRSMRVVLDGVFNHASRGFFQFHDILENGLSSPYLDWFIVNGWPLYAYDSQHRPNYAAWWGLRALPKFNLQTPEVREFLLGVAGYWIEQGVDGWRLDVPGEIDDDNFWRDFRRVVKSRNPDAYIVGEIWHEAQRWLQGDQFDAVMNYLLTKACLGFFVGHGLNQALTSGAGYAPVDPLSAESFAAAIEYLLGLYSTQINQVQLNLLDSHDTARFLTLARGDESALRLAVLFVMCFPGAPCIYYGDEVGMEGGRDPDCRRSFSWEAGRWNRDLRDYFKRCIALRKSHPALRRGEFRTLLAQNDLYCFGRRLDGETVVCALNTGAGPRPLDIPVEGYLPARTVLHGVWDEGEARVRAGRLSGLTLPPRSGVVLVQG
ncbi:MAG TPA: glycoside hydrolase family 13 protein [Anaerolineae bacterium]|nr:glycoside hydrolase family 13 protein [Anaerolineae bacterium]